MRVLILHTDDPKIEKSVAALQRAMEQSGTQRLKSPKASGSVPISRTLFSGMCCHREQAGETADCRRHGQSLKRTTRLEGKRAAFVHTMPGSAKALRKYEPWERQGGSLKILHPGRRTGNSGHRSAFEPLNLGSITRRVIHVSF